MRRDELVAKGRTLRVRFVIDYEVPLDDDLLQDGEESVTIAQVEEWMGGKYRSSDKVYAYLRGDYDATVVEHTFHLADVSSPGDEPRFELEHEQRTREWEHGGPLIRPTYIDVPEPEPTP